MIRIELKNITHNERNSEETHCYAADLYVDGVKIGAVRNSGHGGSDMFDPLPGHGYEAYRTACDRVKAEWPPIDLTHLGMPGETMPNSLEVICGNLVNEWLGTKALTRRMLKSVLFFDPDRLAIMQVAKKGDAAAAYRYVETAAPKATILNTEPLEVAQMFWRFAA